MIEAKLTENEKQTVLVRLTPRAYDKLTLLATKEHRKYGPQAAFMLEAQLRDELEEAA